MEIEDLPLVIVYPEDWAGPLVSHPTAWHLRSDEPEEALRRFAGRRGSYRLVRLVC